jgi:23S rRNA (uridine2552-2'-O)-methyltransferase
MGPDIKALSDTLRAHFTRVKSFKPASSRPESMETFYIALGYKGLPPPDPPGPGNHAA